MRPRCVVFHFLRQAHFDPMSTRAFQFYPILSYSVYVYTYTIIFLKYLRPKFTHAWLSFEASLIEYIESFIVCSITLYLIPGTQLSICVGGRSGF